MERSCWDSGREDWPEHHPRELDIRLTSTVARLMFMLVEPAVMVVMRMFDGLFMESGLLDGGMRSS